MFSVNMNVIELGVPIPEKISEGLHLPGASQAEAGFSGDPTNCLPTLLCSFHTWPPEHHGFPSVPLADPSQASWKQSVLTGELQAQPLVFLSALTMPTAVVILATSMPRASPTSPTTMSLYRIQAPCPAV